MITLKYNTTKSKMQVEKIFGRSYLVYSSEFKAADEEIQNGTLKAKLFCFLTLYHGRC